MGGDHNALERVYGNKTKVTGRGPVKYNKNTLVSKKTEGKSERETKQQRLGVSEDNVHFVMGGRERIREKNS